MASTKAPLWRQKPCSLIGSEVSQLKAPGWLARSIALEAQGLLPLVGWMRLASCAHVSHAGCHVWQLSGQQKLCWWVHFPLGLSEEKFRVYSSEFWYCMHVRWEWACSISSSQRASLAFARLLLDNAALTSNSATINFVFIYCFTPYPTCRWSSDYIASPSSGGSRKGGLQTIEELNLCEVRNV